MNRKPKKNSDKGFTLVEVLVAVVVLAIVVIPLLNSFYMASRTNAKAKKLMDATTAAQNVFEELKGEKLDDFITAHSETLEKILDGSGNPQLDEQGKEMYRHILPITSNPTGYQMTVDQKTFNVRVTLDPLKYTTKQGDAVKNTEYNSQFFSTISKLDPSSNAFFYTDTGTAFDNAAATALAADALPSSIQTMQDTMSRTIKIEIEYDATSKLCEVFGTYIYYDALGGSFSPAAREKFYSNNTALSNELSNIFVCYLPMYSPSGTKNLPKEKIIIENPKNYPVNIYLIKQTDYDDTVLPNVKSNYGVELEVNEGSRIWDKAVTSIATNLKFVENNVIPSELVKVTYTGPTSGMPSTMTEALDIMTDISRPDKAVRIYKVKVEIFEKDDVAYAEALTTMEGTKIE